MGSPLFQLQFHGKTYSATDLSTLVLRRLKEDAEARLGDEVDRAVITVPAYFADAQRKATIDAGQAAGFQVLRIINEPTAAALAYGLQKTGVDETVLIYDLGGGTFDVTVARITPDEIVILSTAGDHDLGGKNWDDRIATLPRRAVRRRDGLRPARRPGRAQRGAWSAASRRSGRCRSGPRPAVTLQLGTERRSFELLARRVRGDDLPAHGPHPPADRGGTGRGRLSWPRLDGVLLVGGSTRMPMVRTYVSQMAGKPPRPASTSTRSWRLGRPSRPRSRWARASPTPSRASRSAGGPRGLPPEAAHGPQGDRRHVAQPGHDRRQP